MITTTPPSRIRVTQDMTAAWRHIDLSLIVLVLVTSAYGAVLVYSTSRHGSDPNLVLRQIVFIALGVVAMAATAAVDYRRLRDWSRWIYPAMLLVLVGVLIPGVGSVHKNIRAWYSFGEVQIQPAEFAKVGLIVVLASFLGSLGAEIRLRHALVCLTLTAIPMGLILLQPDLGTALVFVVIVVGMLVVAGLPLRHLVALVVVGVVAIAGILSSDALDDYQRDRLTAFVSPDTASAKAIYNTRQAQNAIASGGLTGQGLFEGPQTTGRFVPEQQTDFIFTVAGEELGFVGSALLLALFGAILWRIWRAAHLAADETGRLMCVGVFCMIAFHIFENVGMNLGIMPVTGIPLPLVSYGGSSMLTTYMAVGLALNVHMRRFS